jgi:hypothetical protein
MNTFAIIVNASNNKEAIDKSLKSFSKSSNHSISGCINYTEEQKLFESTAKNMVQEYINLKKSTKDMIKKFEDRVKEDDFYLIQMKKNLKRYEDHNYYFSQEWKLVYFENDEVNHVDDFEYYEEILNNNQKENLFICLLDIL